MNITSQTIATYNKIARNYAQQIETKIDSQAITQFLSFLPSKAKILDVGCASGRDTALFQKNGYDCIGIDMSQQLLKQAKLLHPHISVHYMDMRCLSFKDQSFDGIWAHASLLHIKRDEVNLVLQEFYRVLKKHGIMYITVKEGEGNSTIFEEELHNEPRHFTFFSETEISEFLSQNNFQSLQLKRVRSKSRRNLTWIHSVSKKQ